MAAHGVAIHNVTAQAVAQVQNMNINIKIGIANTKAPPIVKNININVFPNHPKMCAFSISIPFLSFKMLINREIAKMAEKLRQEQGR